MNGLDEMEEDALRELFNLSFGRAAATLSEMVDGEIILSLPCLSLLSEAEMLHRLADVYGSAIGMVGMRFRFIFAEDRAIAGMAVLVLRAAEVAHLLDALYGGHVPEEMLTQVEGEAMQSTGDVLLYTCVSSLSALLGSDIAGDVPHYYRGSLLSLRDFLLPSGEFAASPESCSALEVAQWLLLRVDFALLGKEVAGSLLLWMDGSALPILKEGLDGFLANPMG
jgi:chemotaxis protein CheC